jgi:hypothetical protein
MDVTLADTYEIKSMAGCCGCKAILYNVTRDKKLAEQFVMETNCGLYEPSKHLFTFNTKGKLTDIKSLIAVTDNSFTYPLTDIDRKALIKLDSIYADWHSVNKRQIVFANIKGFKEGANTHMPLGVKVPAPIAK